MNFIELKESEPLELTEGIKYIHYPTNPDGSNNSSLAEDIIFCTRLFTDGEIEEESSVIITDGEDCSEFDVDMLKTKRVYLNKYTYAIVLLIAQEWRDIGNVHGWFYVVREATIYLANKEDTDALKTAESLIAGIPEENRSAYRSSLFGMGRNVDNYKIDKLYEDVYTVRRIR